MEGDRYRSGLLQCGDGEISSADGEHPRTDRRGAWNPAGHRRSLDQALPAKSGEGPSVTIRIRTPGPAGECWLSASVNFLGLAQPAVRALASLRKTSPKEKKSSAAPAIERRASPCKCGPGTVCIFRESRPAGAAKAGRRIQPDARKEICEQAGWQGRRNIWATALKAPTGWRG